MAMSSGGCADYSRRTTCLDVYGSEYLITRHDVASASGKAAHTPDIEQRRWTKIKKSWEDSSITLTRGLTLTRSRQEREFFDKLGALGLTIVIQKHTHGWFIDGYIVDDDTYVQFDGIYWHKQSDKVERDTAQNVWFRENGLKLVRITDVEYRQPGFDVQEWYLASCKPRDSV